MRVAVTGANGFIGRHVLAELARRPVDIVAASRTPVRPHVPRDRLEAVVLEMADPAEPTVAILAACDVIIHLAWGGLPQYRSRTHFETELPMQYAFLKRLVEQGAPALVPAGTCLEYGMRSGELTEDLPGIEPTPYGFAKDCLRRQLEFLCVEHACALTWVRLFFTFGEGQGPWSLFSQLHAAAARGDESFDMSGGEQLRDYLPVTEVARLLVDCALLRRSCGVVNVCAGRPISVRRLVEGWIEERGWRLRLHLGRYPYPDYEPLAFWGSRRKLDGLLHAHAS